MNRIDRLTAILTQLQSKRLVKASEIANRFDISLRTVYRDIRALGEAGVPVTGEAGMGYSIVDGYRLPPVMFTKDEALAFLMAEKIVEKVTDQHNSQQFQSAMYKIKAVLRSAEKEVLEDVAENIEIVKRSNSLLLNGQPNLLQIILSSIAGRTLVHITYTTFEQQETTRRNIEPVGIYYAYEQWYLIAFCRLREAYRTFRVDRISGIELRPEKFQQQHPSLKSFLEQIEKKEKLQKVVLEVDQAVTKYLREEKYRQGFVMETDKGDKVEMIFMTSSIEFFARWLIMLADHVTILQPQVLRERVELLLEQMLARTKKPKAY